jgi:X-X-X-Leu-X-X-Gly heptad repeat protein
MSRSRHVSHISQYSLISAWGQRLRLSHLAKNRKLESWQIGKKVGKLAGKVGKLAGKVGKLAGKVGKLAKKLANWQELTNCQDHICSQQHAVRKKVSEMLRLKMSVKFWKK